jgi:hypothetical protein
MNTHDTAVASSMLTVADGYRCVWRTGGAAPCHTDHRKADAVVRPSFRACDHPADTILPAASPLRLVTSVLEWRKWRGAP